MAIGSGLGAQLGIAAETTYGTYVAPSKFIEFTQESLALKKTTAQSAGIAAGRLLALSSRRVLTRREVEGSLDIEVANWKNYLLLT
ncbi:phage tail tube protein [Bacillus cereus]